MSFETLTYAALGARLKISPEAARSLAKRLRSVIERHCPSVRSQFAELRNVFFLWDRAGS